MAHPQFDQFLREVLKLPTAVFEGPSFSYSEQAARMCFPLQVRPRLRPAAAAAAAAERRAFPESRSRL